LWNNNIWHTAKIIHAAYICAQFKLFHAVYYFGINNLCYTIYHQRFIADVLSFWHDKYLLTLRFFDLCTYQLLTKFSVIIGNM